MQRLAALPQLGRRPQIRRRTRRSWRSAQGRGAGGGSNGRGSSSNALTAALNVKRATRATRRLGARRRLQLGARGRATRKALPLATSARRRRRKPTDARRRSSAVERRRRRRGAPTSARQRRRTPTVARRRRRAEEARKTLGQEVATRRRSKAATRAALKKGRSLRHGPTNSAKLGHGKPKRDPAEATGRPQIGAIGKKPAKRNRAMSRPSIQSPQLGTTSPRFRSRRWRKATTSTHTRWKLQRRVLAFVPTKAPLRRRKPCQGQRGESVPKLHARKRKKRPRPSRQRRACTNPQQPRSTKTPSAIARHPRPSPKRLKRAMLQLKVAIALVRRRRLGQRRTSAREKPPGQRPRCPPCHGRSADQLVQRRRR